MQSWGAVKCPLLQHCMGGGLFGGNSFDLSKRLGIGLSVFYTVWNGLALALYSVSFCLSPLSSPEASGPECSWEGAVVRA